MRKRPSNLSLVADTAPNGSTRDG